MKDIKSIVTQLYEFEFWENLTLVAIWEVSENQDSDATVKRN